MIHQEDGMDHEHDQRFDGDDPYLVCECGARWDALSGRPLNDEACAATDAAEAATLGEPHE